ncbi:MAG: formylglycine-generating enzyme family protein, partial [Sphaerochaetaceae bacterium]
MGATDYPYFIESGEHEVQLHKAGISYASYMLEVDHPVFLTWLFHRKQETLRPPVVLDTEEKEAINRFNLQEIADASAILDYDAVTRSQPLFANLLQDLQALDFDSDTTTRSIEIALRFISNETMLDEAKDALTKFDVPTTTVMSEILTTAEQVMRKEANTVLGVAGQVPELSIAQRSLSYGDIDLTGFAYPATSFVMGTETLAQYSDVNEAGVSVHVPSFVLGANEISQYQWALFLEENPYWDKENKDTLLNAGLVEESYLQGMTISSVFVTSKPVFNVSYYAAVAFCEWLSEKTGKKVFLPTEAMWSLAALHQDSKQYATSLSPSPDISKGP